MAKQIISITDAAADQIKLLIKKRDRPTLGIKIGVKTGGCSGLTYTFEYAEQEGKFDEIINDKGVKILVDPKAVMYILGTMLDYADEKVKSGFIFTNPNQKSSCGCGKSFNT